MKSQDPTDNQTPSIQQRLADLLTSNLSPEEFTRQLFWINYAQAEANDPDVAFVLCVCAIPALFDAEIIGVLRGTPDDSVTNQRLLEALKQYSFVQVRPEGGHTYHDNTRDVVLQYWQTEERRQEYETLRNKLVEFYLERGKEQSERNDNADALQNFSRALEIQPKNAELYRKRAETLADLGNYDSAQQDVQQVFEQEPEAGKSYWIRGYVYAKQKKYEEALADYTRAVELQPDDGYNYAWRGRVYYDQRQYDLALADFSRAIELNPEHGSCYYWRGRVYYDQRQYEEALADYTRAVELQPDDGYNYAWRGRVYYDQR
ncbi:MAG: tetratricopeptide repeat protein, partial [Chloroflexia bacterium]|nr:tetratricopeptide repeat protein [Chloroflexia bacterium]